MSLTPERRADSDIDEQPVRLSPEDVAQPKPERLKRRQSPGGVPDRRRIRSEAASPRERALIIEDDANVRDVVEKLLDQRGYHVHSCDNGVDAWPMILSVQPHLLVLDLQLPGVGGLELLVRIRRDPRAMAMAVLICSGATAEVQALKDRFDRLGCKVVEKPFELNLFEQRLEELTRDFTRA